MIFAFDAGPLSQSPWDAWDAAQNKSVSGQWMYLPSASPSYLRVEMWEKKHVDPKVIYRPWMMTKKICSAHVGEPSTARS